ncbi:hypothetical protein ABT071_21865 [Streptomyces sp. NPDC002506]|uniref:hypothetical protein n=1 Tax=Streptomyces sp. NPDC002506 TaxID=3154536 RepID=UPI0033246514
MSGTRTVQEASRSDYCSCHEGPDSPLSSTQVVLAYKVKDAGRPHGSAGPAPALPLRADTAHPGGAARLSSRHRPIRGRSPTGSPAKELLAPEPSLTAHHGQSVRPVHRRARHDRNAVAHDRHRHTAPWWRIASAPPLGAEPHRVRPGDAPPPVGPRPPDDTQRLPVKKPVRAGLTMAAKVMYRARPMVAPYAPRPSRIHRSSSPSSLTSPRKGWFSLPGDGFLTHWFGTERADHATGRQGTRDRAPLLRLPGAEPQDWSTLTIRQSAHDCHAVVSALRRVYRGSWISTGWSKGGTASAYHRRLYPHDVAGTVAHAAPNDMDDSDGSAYDRFLGRIPDPELPALRAAEPALRPRHDARRPELDRPRRRATHVVHGQKDPRGAAERFTMGPCTRDSAEFTAPGATHGTTSLAALSAPESATARAMPARWADRAASR